MKGKTVEVVPFSSYTYKVKNRYTNEYFGIFDSILEAKEYVVKNNAYCGYHDSFGDSHTITSEEQNSYELYLYGQRHNKVFNYRTPRRPYMIMNQYGDIISVLEIKAAGQQPYRNTAWEAHRAKADAIERGLVKIQGDGNKIKPDWSYRESWCSVFNRKDYRNDALGYFRRISTVAEHRANAGCYADYGPGLVRGSRSLRQLPSSWSDRSCGAYETRACWKHNSKRRNQWKPK